MSTQQYSVMPAHTRSLPQPRHGFTLVELLAVLTILAILAAIAFPSYAAHVRSARRSEAMQNLLALMQQQERYYTQHQRYIAFSSEASDPKALPFRWWLGEAAASSAYQLEGQACKGFVLEDCIVLSATPGGVDVDRSFSDPDCGVLSLTSTGRRSATGPAKRCWP